MDATLALTFGMKSKYGRAWKRYLISAGTLPSMCRNHMLPCKQLSRLGIVRLAMAPHSLSTRVMQAWIPPILRRRAPPVEAVMAVARFASIGPA